jgi:glycosyltransferase involved in cell wall biosynthesis
VTVPAISLIVSTYDTDIGDLTRLFDSLIHQTCQDFEVIVVDQNRDTRLLTLCTRTPWPFKVKHIRTPNDFGASRGRNRGIKESVGMVLVFPDDDCWYPSDFLAKGLEMLDKTDADFVGGRAADEKGRSINGRYNKTSGFITRDNVWTSGIEWATFWRRYMFDPASIPVTIAHDNRDKFKEALG